MPEQVVSGGRAVGMVWTVSVAVPKTGRMCEDDRGGDVVGGHLFRVMIAALWLDKKKPKSYPAILSLSSYVLYAWD